MESYNLLQTPALPWAVDCPWTQGKPKGTMLYGMLPFALPAHPTLGHPTSCWEWICRSSNPAVGGSFHTVALTRSSSKDRVSPTKLTEVSFDSRLCNRLVWGENMVGDRGKGQGRGSGYTGQSGTEERGPRTKTAGYGDGEVAARDIVLEFSSCL